MAKKKLTQNDYANILCLKSGIEIYKKRIDAINEVELSDDSKEIIRAFLKQNINKAEIELAKYQLLQ